MKGLEEKAMLVRLCIRQWTGYKHNKSVSSVVHKSFETKGHAGQFNKVLLNLSALEGFYNAS